MDHGFFPTCEPFAVGATRVHSFELQTACARYMSTADAYYDVTGPPCWHALKRLASLASDHVQSLPRGGALRKPLNLQYIQCLREGTDIFAARFVFWLHDTVAAGLSCSSIVLFQGPVSINDGYFMNHK